MLHIRFLKIKGDYMYRLLILLICLFSLSCSRGYKNETSPRDPEAVAFADQALDLQNQAEKLSDTYRSNMALREFAARAGRFHNSCRRFGCGSIEGRAAFDQLYFQSGEVDRELEKSPNPELMRLWMEQRDNVLLPIARKLGYRPGQQ
jgi:hypothetical protein